MPTKKQVAAKKKLQKRSRKQKVTGKRARRGGGVAEMRYNVDDFFRYRGDYGDSNVLGSYTPATTYQNFKSFMNGKTSILNQSYSDPFNTQYLQKLDASKGGPVTMTKPLSRHSTTFSGTKVSVFPANNYVPPTSALPSRL